MPSKCTLPPAQRGHVPVCAVRGPLEQAGGCCPHSESRLLGARLENAPTNQPHQGRWAAGCGARAAPRALVPDVPPVAVTASPLTALPPWGRRCVLLTQPSVCPFRRTRQVGLPGVSRGTADRAAGLLLCTHVIAHRRALSRCHSLRFLPVDFPCRVFSRRSRLAREGCWRRLDYTPCLPPRGGAPNSRPR